MDDTTHIQWYPGHIAQMEQKLQEIVRQLDVVVELVDARIPTSTQYEGISYFIRKKKPVLLILNKADLADPKWTEDWTFHYFRTHSDVHPFDSLSGKSKEKIIDLILWLGEDRKDRIFRRWKDQGLRDRPVRTGVIGMPNVGKSSFINALIGHKKTRTGHRAGVTRTTQWVRIHPRIELLDTPGLIPQKLDSQETAKMLASVYSIGDAAFEKEPVASFLIEKIETFYPGLIQKAFDLSEDQGISLESIAKRRGYILPGGALDLQRASEAVLKDYRHGRIGRITLERPPEKYEEDSFL